MYDIINMSFKCLPFLYITSIRNYKYSPSLFPISRILLVNRQLLYWG